MSEPAGGTGGMAISIEIDIEAALQHAVLRHEDGFVMRWLAVVETSDPDGVRGLWLTSSADLSQWDALGLAEHTRLMVRSGVYGYRRMAEMDIEIEDDE